MGLISIYVFYIVEILCVFVGNLLTTPMVTYNSSSMTVELRTCVHDDDVFKYHAYIFTYLPLFPVAFVCNTGALVAFFLQSSRRFEHTNTYLSSNFHPFSLLNIRSTCPSCHRGEWLWLQNLSEEIREKCKTPSAPKKTYCTKEKR